MTPGNNGMIFTALAVGGYVFWLVVIFALVLRDPPKEER